VSRERLVADLKRDENTGPLKNGRMFPYPDSVGVLTIGWGRNLKDKGISLAEGENLLSNDIDEAVHALYLYPWYQAADPVRQAAYTNMMFNLGPARFKKFRDLRAAAEQAIRDPRKYEDVAVAALDSRWADQVGARALRIAEMLRSGVWV